MKTKTMSVKDYQCTITVGKASLQKAFESIGRVQDWWAKKFEGSAQQLNDAFTVRFGETWVTFSITEVIPNKKIVWYVTDCNLHWIDDKKEWKDTKVIWELASKNGETTITMTHIGLVPQAECYENCKPGWDAFLKNSLPKLIIEGKGLPD